MSRFERYLKHDRLGRAARYGVVLDSWAALRSVKAPAVTRSLTEGGERSGVQGSASHVMLGQQAPFPEPQPRVRTNQRPEKTAPPMFIADFHPGRQALFNQLLRRLGKTGI